MINFLHNFNPYPIMLQIGPLSIRWYGICIVSGIISAFFVVSKLAKKNNISASLIIDAAFFSILFGIVGARIYHIFLELPYYLEHPLNTFKIWNGGIAIHGGIIAGSLALFYFTQKHKLNFIKILALFAPGLSLAQAIGRWGNYFNQELYGLPTNLPWGIPIETANRVSDYIDYNFFHPTFLYASIGNFCIFIILLLLSLYFLKKPNKKSEIYIISSYLILYATLRFSLEIIRIDPTPIILDLRTPQIASIIMFILGIILLSLPQKLEKIAKT